MKNNEDLQRDVMDAIKWEPLLHAAEIGVTAKDGIITLTGEVDTYAKKLEAEDAAKSIKGVKAVVEKIDVKFENSFVKDDNEIAISVVNALKWSWQFDSNKLKVKVEDGWVTLDGELNWNYQRESAKKSITYLKGVRGVINHIEIKSDIADAIEKKDIELALTRNWTIDGKNIAVKVLGNRVTLNGTVHSLYQKDKAEQIVWNAPGVWAVDNNLDIDYLY